MRYSQSNFTYNLFSHYRSFVSGLGSFVPMSNDVEEEEALPSRPKRMRYFEEQEKEHGASNNEKLTSKQVWYHEYLLYTVMMYMVYTVIGYLIYTVIMCMLLTMLI